jgi:hypothetical protein
MRQLELSAYGPEQPRVCYLSILDGERWIAHSQRRASPLVFRAADHRRRPPGAWRDDRQTPAYAAQCGSVACPHAQCSCSSNASVSSPSGETTAWPRKQSRLPRVPLASVLEEGAPAHEPKETSR